MFNCVVIGSYERISPKMLSEVRHFIGHHHALIWWGICVAEREERLLGNILYKPYEDDCGNHRTNKIRNECLFVATNKTAKISQRLATTINDCSCYMISRRNNKFWPICGCWHWHKVPWNKRTHTQFTPPSTPEGINSNIIKKKSLQCSRSRWL